MTTFLFTTIAVAFSTVAILWLRRIDPKRARVIEKFATDKPPKHTRPIGWALALLPMIPLFALGNIAALIIWFAAMTVIGWLFAMQRGKVV